LLARESSLRERQLGNQLPDSTYGFRVVRPEWEKILTVLHRGECNTLMVPDIDRPTRDPRTLEDLIDAVELYGWYVASLTGNIDLTTTRAFPPRGAGEPAEPGVAEYLAASYRRAASCRDERQESRREEPAVRLAQDHIHPFLRSRRRVPHSLVRPLLGSWDYHLLSGLLASFRVSPWWPHLPSVTVPVGRVGPTRSVFVPSFAPPSVFPRDVQIRTRRSGTGRPSGTITHGDGSSVVRARQWPRLTRIARPLRRTRASAGKASCASIR
jgi:hypothetical protein